MNKSSIIFLIFLFPFIGKTSDPIKSLKALRLSGFIHIDGIIDEEVWAKAEVATDFTQKEPNPGLASTFRSEIRLLYDNHAIYIGAKLWDPNPNKILKEYSLRDEIGNADNFTVFFDPFKSGLNGFQFAVTASGVQSDAIVNNNMEDKNWNAVWESAISQDDKGWYIELKIPYSALRFPSDPEQAWNVQFSREIRRIREISSWSPINPNISGWVQQSGRLTHINDIVSPVRLSLTPYVSGYLNVSHDPQANPTNTDISTAYSAGLDLKYGLNDAFTLDMTLIPDFGQVISDNQVLNLTPFEVFYEENRQFFTEGTELFNKENIFYSRRIGGIPLKYNEVYGQLQTGETILKNPGNTRLYNATKLSGRTSTGTGIGFFNAIAAEENAVIEKEDGTTRLFKTNPLTNYNAIVVDQNLKNNSFVALMNTNVTRAGTDYDANVTGSYFSLRTKNQEFQVAGFGVVSQQFYENNTNRGFSYNIDLAKVSGIWTYGIGQKLYSDKYNPNDMGFLLFPNNQNFYIKGGYSQFQPQNPKLQHIILSGVLNYKRLYKPNVYTNLEIEINEFILFKNRLGAGWNVSINPKETHDYFEPRQFNLSQYLSLPASVLAGGFISTDYRKKIALDINMDYGYYHRPNQKSYSLGFSPRLRFNDRFSLITSTAIDYYGYEPGFADRNQLDTQLDALGNTDILFGNRNRLTVENAITGKYIFNAVMGLNIRIRHYWDKVLYQDFGKLASDGSIQTIVFDGLNQQGDPIFDRNFNIFNIDLQYNWRFAPGSDVIVVWKNQIFNSDKAFDANWISNFNSLSRGYQENNISLRVLYYLDYLYLKSKN